jgi:hypothetical protein
MDLVRAGLLSLNSPKAVWEVTAAGQKELEANNLEATWAKVMAAKQARER